MDYPYVSLQQSLAQTLVDKAKVLLARAADYRAAGKPDYAIGCVRKANKKLAEAAKLLGWP